MSTEYVTLTNGQVVRKDTLRKWELQRIVADHIRAAVPNRLKSKRRRNENRRLNRNGNRQAVDGVEIGVRVPGGHSVQVPILHDDFGSRGDASIVQDDGNGNSSDQVTDGEDSGGGTLAPGAEQDHEEQA